jgi:hypothetical protein
VQLSTSRRLRRAVRSLIPTRHENLSRALHGAIEPMESRLMMAVGLDGNGFTTVTPSSDTKTIFVSTSDGSDSNTGLSADAPVKSLAKGVSLLRSGSPDWMLLKKGDVWNEAFPSWTKSGRSASEPMLVSSYGSGTQRPDIKAGTKNGFASITAFHDVAVLGLHLEANTRNPDSADYTGTDGGYGIQIISPVNGFLVEDNQVDHFKYNLSLQGFSGYAKNISVRRNSITDSYDPGAKSQGLYASMTDGLTIDGNVFDHNGWNEKIASAKPNEFSHNIYLWENNTNSVVRNNIIANASSHGLQARGGGIIENNLFLRNPIGALLGNGSTVTAGGVSGRVTGNVFIDDRDINGAARGWAIEVGNLKAGGNTIVSDNIIASDTQNKYPAIKLETDTGATNASQGVGINDLTITRNIVYKWYQGLNIASGFNVGGSGMTALNDLTVSDNDFQMTTSQKIINHNPAIKVSEEAFSDNRYYDSQSSSGWFAIQNATTSLASWQSKVESTAQSQKMDYPDPSRTAATYNASLGGAASLTGFLSEARKQGKATWRSAYATAAAISYIRAGFTGATPSGNNPGDPGTSTPPPTDTGTNAAPTAALIASDRTVAGSSAQQFKVTYTDDTGVLTSSFGNGDVKVTGPNGFAQAATFVSADSTSNGTPRTATYQITAPGGSWDSADNGAYTVSLNSNGVRDTAGLYAPGQTLGSFRAAIAAAPSQPPTSTPSQPSDGTDTTPPTVVWSNYDPTQQTVTMRFREDVSMSLNTSDLRLKNEQTVTLIPNSQMKMSYDKSTNTATWTFSEPIPSADYKVMLSAPVVSDAAGNKLDGNGDGIAGDDYVMRISAEEMLAAASLAAMG